MNKDEIWKEVPNYEGHYEVSNRGNVRSMDRFVTTKNGRKRFYKGKVVKGDVNNGYRRTSFSINSKTRTYKFSQLVAMAFLGHKPNGHSLVIDHVNGIRSDDRLENLRIVTKRENTSECFRSDRDNLSSSYTGVYWCNTKSKWVSGITYDGLSVNLGVFNDEHEAYRAYQKALGKINDGSFNPDDYKPIHSSKYKGVHFNKDAKTWTGRASVDGGRVYVGQFQTEIEAYNAIVDYKLNK